MMRRAVPEGKQGELKGKAMPQETVSPHNIVVFEKQIFARVIKKCPVSYDIRGFITVFTRACNGSVS
jgi:hypothetical protein